MVVLEQFLKKCNKKRSINQSKSKQNSKRSKNIKQNYSVQYKDHWARPASKKKYNKNKSFIVKQDKELDKIFFASIEKIYNQIVSEYKDKRENKKIIY